MTVMTGRVVQGKVELDEGTLPEGTPVTVLSDSESATFHLGPAEVEALLESIAEADRGEVISGEQLLEELRRL